MEEWSVQVPVWTIAIITAFVPLTATKVGVFAVLQHILGYAFYINKSVMKEIKPNPTTWMIFMYSTTITAGLEAYLIATALNMPFSLVSPGAFFESFKTLLNTAGYILYLPIICALGSIIVATICFVRGEVRWPERIEDRRAFRNDVLLMCAALIAAGLHIFGAITDTQKYVAIAFFLIFSNWSTFYAFQPILRDAYENPDREHSLAWMVWTSAYLTLGIATVWGWIEEGSKDPVMLGLLLLYPLSCTYLHAKVAWYARSTRHGGIPLNTEPASP